jgi:hypothetical protein
MEYLKLLWLNLIVKKRNLFEYFKVLWKYYPHSLFRHIDLSLLSLYFFKSPFKISKEFLIKRGEREVYAYGETPLTTLQEIATQCQISEQDVVFELGSGRGRGCFWLHCFLGCRVVGIDYIPAFIAKAQHIQNKYHLHDIEFRCENFLKTDCREATVIYLFGTCLEDDFIQKLIKKFKNLPVGTKIITVSYPLSDYASEPIFRVLHTFSVPFNWGEAEVYLQVRS